MAGPSGGRQPFSFVSQEVVEATCQCLLAQAEEGEKKGQGIEQIERIVLEESPVKEAQSNGAIENAIRQIQGQIRTTKDCLESRLGG